MTTILPRRGTAAQWTSANPVLAMGELGFETDTKKWKRGDGTTAWTALAYYQPAWADVTAKPAVIAAGADQAAARNAISAVGKGELVFNVKDYGAACDGITDDTSAWAAAISAAVTFGGGVVFFAGTSVASQVELKSKVGIRGNGTDKSILKQKSGRADGQHLILLDDPDAVYVSLENFTIDGNKDSQTSGTGSGIYFTNITGVGVLARHRISSIFIRNVNGNGLEWASYHMGGSYINNVHTYKCTGSGISLTSFTDSFIDNIDVGRSGSHGVYVGGCNGTRFSNIKSWYSGIVDGTTPTTNASGIYIRGKADTSVFTNISTQENAGHGMLVYGPSAGNEVMSITVNNFTSDSDNVAGTNYSGLSLNGVKNSKFDINVTSYAPLATIPYSGVSISNSSGNSVRAKIKQDSVTWNVNGPAVGDNHIDLQRSVLFTSPTTSTVPVSVYQNREQVITLTANRTISNPATPSGAAPVGLQYRIVLVQDATGGRVVTWGSAYKIPASTVFGTAANSRTVVDFECVGDGNWIMVGFITGIPA